RTFRSGESTAGVAAFGPSEAGRVFCMLAGSLHSPVKTGALTLHVGCRMLPAIPPAEPQHAVLSTLRRTGRTLHLRMRQRRYALGRTCGRALHGGGGR